MSALIRFLWLLPRRLAIGLVRIWQILISPLYGDVCRFSPHCSQYAIEALREWGLIAGTVLTAWRILRCNPFSRGGADPVPERHRRRLRIERNLVSCPTSSD
jgi:putative membrane protein insertion efficiency factor